jgi:hypothetical protein
MNEAPATTPQDGLRTPGSLQAILQRADGTIETAAVTVPLPEAIIRVDVGTNGKEHWFQRERSSDSVLRYLEREAPPSSMTPRHCTRCGQQRSEYYVHKAAAQGSPDESELWVFCVDCYVKTAIA